MAHKDKLIPAQTIENVRNKSDILTIVGEYVALKKRGKNYLGLCPFHSEKTPSFTVSPDKQIFHCFGCGEGGNVFTFLMKTENISFAESVEILGNRTGIHVENSGIRTAQSIDKDKFYSIMDFAQRYYTENLASEGGAIAQDYIKNRGIAEEAVKAFCLGYSNDSWSGLMDNLAKKGVSTSDMLTLGLIIERTDKSGYYDRFRGRLMFPIYDLRGRTIGFGGRILRAAGAEDAKYVNSPDSPIYNKGLSLFGVKQSKEEIKKNKTALLVEGNVDLIACWQSGLKNVIAPLGTSLTEQQAKMIKRFADKVVIAFDADPAGQAAANKSIDILREQGLSVYVAKYEGGKDPDDAIKALGAEKFASYIEKALPWMEFKLAAVFGKYNLNEIEAKAKAVKECAFIIGQESDEFIKKGYIKLVAEKLGFDHEEIAGEVKRQSYSTRSNDQARSYVKMEKPSAKILKAEETIIKLAVDDAGVLETLRQNIKWQDFTGTETRLIAEILETADISKGDIHHFMLETLPDEATKSFFSRTIVADTPIENKNKMALDCINTIKAHHLKYKMDELKIKMVEAEKAGNVDQMPALHRQFTEANEAFRHLSFN